MHCKDLLEKYPLLDRDGQGEWISIDLNLQTNVDKTVILCENCTNYQMKEF